MIYLDSAATSFYKPEQVEQAVCRAFHTIGNAGRGAHAPTLEASRVLYRTRAKLAQLFHAEHASRIAFTANVTQALNLAIDGLIQAGDHVVTTVCEHNSVLRPLYKKQENGVFLTIVSADENGTIDPQDIQDAMRENTRAIVIHHASNVTGNVVPIEKIAAIAHRAGALLLVDAAQTAGGIPIDVQAMGIDVLCFTGHKSLLGPQGTGGIYVREGLSIPSLLVGGSGVHSFDKHQPTDMPTALEAGTANGHGIAGLEAAVDFLLETGVETIHAREDALMRRFIAGVREIPLVKLYGDMDAPLRAPIVTLNLGTADAAMVSDVLWEDDEICVRAGAHCAPLMHQHLGTVEQGAVRFSFSYWNTEADIDRAIQAVRNIAAEYEEANA
ncbi:aminotransferase class V-fold PLP-dependent enzyme [Butyricicoccus intestinisimiae]|uniref:Aminotransferase class V-fold PLP-dependent enzyme n=1 Tax=Butyricicoccus intestinisimiae TaxID=2841509 RepID=A0ABS6ERI1_9FIRM|nr:aminotransferase class V-fold PLP-dependent enzyme [Butyricicoccus intestinisimiae]